MSEGPVRLPQGLARWHQLVTPAWLAALLQGQPVEAAPEGSWSLFEVGERGPDDFLREHIPGAAYLEVGRLETGPFWNALPDAELLALLLSLGIRHDTAVVLYGRNPVAVGRAAHLLLYAGVADVRLLDGGWSCWKETGCPLAAGQPRAAVAAADFGAQFPGCPEYLVDTEQVKRLLGRPEAVLVSIRSWEEFCGRTSGYDYIEACGEIPGARWGHAGEDGDVNSMRAFLDARDCMLPAEAIAGFWRDAGIHPGQHVCFYCGTGWRASLAFFYAWLMGWESISVYDGGWLEWSSDPRNPRRVGPA